MLYLPSERRKNLLLPALAFVLISFSANDCLAQFYDDFADGDFLANPAWTPDNASNWTVQNGQLRSNSATASSTFYTTTPSLQATSAQWEFLVNLQFNTSSANFVDIFLMADQQNLTSSSINGYFVRIGGTTDEISLYKVVSGSISILINGTDGVTNFSNNILRIKVVRSISNQWTLQYDSKGGFDYILEETATDNTFTTSNYFGIKVTQSTSGFFNKHFFDEIYAGEIVVDNLPPTIQTVKVLSASELELSFNEKVEQASAEDINNYVVNNGVGKPLFVSRLSDQKSVQLTFSKKFLSPATSTIQIEGVQDLLGNRMGLVEKTFFYFEELPSNYKDIVITEIFPDPTPTIGLPESEFIEIYNRSIKAFDLKNWKITDGSSEAAFPSKIIMPGEYIILVPSTSAPSWNSFGTVIGLSNFPTLNNSSDNLVLKNVDNVEIDRISYQDSWYRDEDKKQGGWTLELIDIENICAEDENWIASENPVGGTPGKINSVFANKPDVKGPVLLSAIAASNTQLKLLFNEKLEDDVPTSENIETTLGVSHVNFSSGSLRELLIDLINPIEEKKEYQVIVHNVYDCAGNKIQDEFKSAFFAIPSEVSPGDVVINEILFNPRPFGVDFVELYNVSDKYLNLRNWSIGNFENDEAINQKTISENDLLMRPKQFIVFTTNPQIVMDHYPKAIVQNIVKVNSLPSFNDSEGSIVISSSTEALDQFSYTKDLHSILLKYKEGVSLERISAGEPASNIHNWQSASSTVGFATPGYANSNTREEDLSQGSIDINPEIFEPVSGQPSFTQIKYSLQSGGWVANINIYDQHGRKIKTISQNETLATEGFFKWEGDTDDGTKARIGYYIVIAELFNAAGKLQTFKKRVIIGARF